MKTRFAPMLHAAVLFGVVHLAAAASAQRPAEDGDRRDAVLLENGKEITGRLLQRYDEEEWLLLQGGKRVRIDPDDVQSTDTVRDRMNRYFGRRKGRDHADPAVHWTLSQWAQQQGLPHLASLEAWAVLARDPQHAGANEYLGHKQRKSSWRWPANGRWLTPEKFTAYTGDIGHPLEIRSEHFAIQTNAGLLRATDALFDLERMYIYWHDTFGRELELDEIVTPLPLRIFGTQDRFPALSSEKLGYYVPHPYNEKSFIFFDEEEEIGSARPVDLFTVASQHLLYRALARDLDPGGQTERFCAALEIGLGRYVDNVLQGAPGQTQPVAHAASPREVALALGGRRYSLKNMLHLNIRDHFYSTGSLRRTSRTMRAESHWAAVHLFVAFMLDEKANPGARAKLMDFMHIALRDGKGDSSSAFDKAVGERIEKFEKPWREWLEVRSGVPSKPRR